ncbi:MAG: toll/interleukin-1 receptor domain-containing protein [Pseudomonadota bacterium]
MEAVLFRHGPMANDNNVSDPVRDEPAGYIFVSYSRKDETFVSQLTPAIAARGWERWVDVDAIRPSEKWMPSIEAAIDRAEAVLVVVSPNSLASRICGKEVEHAAKQQKRLIPVVYEDVSIGVPEALQELNWIFARDSDSLAEATSQIVEAIETDLDWVHAHTRLLVEATAWDQRGRDASFTLRGTELTELEEHRVVAADKKPRLTRLQSEFLLESRRVSNRRSRLILGGISLSVLIAAVLAVFGWLQREERERQEKIADARRLLSQSEVLRSAPEDEQGRRQEGLRSATRAMAALARLGSDVIDADRAVRESYARVDKRRDPLPEMKDWRVANVTFTEDGRYAVFYTKDEHLVRLDLVDGTTHLPCRRRSDDPSESRGSYGRHMSLDREGRILALRTYGGTNVTGGWNRLAIWDLVRCEVIARHELADDEPDDITGIALTPDGNALLYWGYGRVREWQHAAGTFRDVPIAPTARDFAPNPERELGIAYSPDPDGRALELEVFDLANGDVLYGWDESDVVDRMQWTPSGLVLSMLDRHAFVSSTGERRGLIKVSTDQQMALNENGSVFAVMPDSRTVEVYDVASGERIARTRRKSDVIGIAFLNGLDELALVSNYRFDMDVWQYAESGSYARLRIDNTAERLYFSSDSDTLQAVVGDQTLNWRMPQGPEYSAPEPLPGQAEEQLATESSEDIAPGKRTLREVVGRFGRRAVLLCEKQTRGGCNRRLEMWDNDVRLGTVELEPVLDEVQQAFLTFSGNDEYLIVASRAKLRVLEWQSLADVAEILVNQVERAAVSPGLQRAATLDRDGTTRIWNLAENIQIAQFRLDRHARAMALSDDNRWLAVLKDGGRVVEVYALSPPDLINQACRFMEAICPDAVDASDSANDHFL